MEQPWVKEVTKVLTLTSAVSHECLFLHWLLASGLFPETELVVLDFSPIQFSLVSWGLGFDSLFFLPYPHSLPSFLKDIFLGYRILSFSVVFLFAL